MKILIACDKFKGTFTSKQIGEAIAKILIRKNIETQILEVSDGGDGFLNSMLTLGNFNQIKCETVDALGNKIMSNFLLSKDNTSAIIESSKSIGLKLISPQNRSVLLSGSWGLGITIKKALEQNTKKIMVGVGGTATVDGFCGAANELGFNFLDKNGNFIIPNGKNLIKIANIIVPKNNPTENTQFFVAADVSNTLFGQNGAAKVFGPQKGATPQQVEILELGLKNLADVIKKDLGKDVSKILGGGAGGGIGAGMTAFLNAKIISGSDLVLKTVNFDSLASQSDAVISGEGCFDFQTESGKIVGNIINRCKKLDKKVIIVCGTSQNKMKQNKNIEIIELFDNTPDLETAIKETPTRLSKAFENFNFLN